MRRKNLGVDLELGSSLMVSILFRMDHDIVARILLTHARFVMNDGISKSRARLSFESSDEATTCRSQCRWFFDLPYVIQVSRSNEKHALVMQGLHTLCPSIAWSKVIKNKLKEIFPI